MAPRSDRSLWWRCGRAVTHLRTTRTVRRSFTGDTQPTHGFEGGRGELTVLMAQRTTLPPLTRADGSPVRVLVVDDEPNLTELVASKL